MLADLGVPAHASLVRHSSALAVFLVYAAWVILRRPRSGSPLKLPGRVSSWIWLALLGLTAFALSPALQMLGLSASQASENSLLVALEPLMTVAVAWVLLREPVRRYHLVSFAVALAGFGLLSGFHLSWGRGSAGGLGGNLILACAVLADAGYSSFARKLMPAMEPRQIFGGALLIGVVALFAATALSAGLPDLSRLSTQGVLALLMLGPVGTAATYLYWLHALGRVSIPSMVITLFVQPLIGPLFGLFFLGESLAAPQILGGALMIGAMAIPLITEWVGRKKASLEINSC